jgi:hypothetical protein
MRRVIQGVLLVLVSLNPAHSAESDVTVVGGIDFGFKNLKLDTGSGSILASDFITINPNVGLSYDSFYAITSLDKSISVQPGVDTGGNGAATVLDFSRTELTFTLGYRISPAFSVFTGYTKGRNEFVETSTEFPGGTTVFTATEITFTQSGPFFGIAYSQAFSDKGTLAMSVGYAALDAELNFLRRPSGNTSGSTRGDSTGISYGVTWSGSLTGSLGYRVGAKSTRYEVEDEEAIVERYTAYFIGISNYF